MTKETRRRVLRRRVLRRREREYRWILFKPNQRNISSTCSCIIELYANKRAVPTLPRIFFSYWDFSWGFSIKKYWFRRKHKRSGDGRAARSSLFFVIKRLKTRVRAAHVWLKPTSFQCLPAEMGKQPYFKRPQIANPHILEPIVLSQIRKFP